MFSAAQLRAARGLVDWTRNELAKEAKISPETVKNIEHGIFRPQEDTAQRIIKTFAEHHVVFTEDDGVKISRSSVKTFVGKKGYIEFLEDICEVMKNGGRTCQFNFSDGIIASFGGDKVKEYSEKLAKVSKLDARCLVPEGDMNFPVAHCQYKWLPKAHKDAIPYYAYNNSVALLASGAKEDMVWICIRSEELAKAFYKQFDAHWENAMIASKNKQK
jgi:DNA-binding XRE family transcriptional regulator